MASGFFAILDDIAALMDDVAVTSKIATQKIKHDPFVDTQLAQRIDAGAALYLDIVARFLVLN